jgi:DNA-binding sugar fermentation-stimulating protein
MSDITSGIFKKECVRRFTCEVEVDGKIELCYVASSAKLKNFIDLTDKTVYLLENKGKETKTKYSLFAVEKSKEDVILLNLNIVNIILKDYLIRSGIDKELLKAEISIKHGLKADLVYSGTPVTIYEVKTILAREEEVLFPSVKTKRVKAQLEKFITMLQEGYQVRYCFFVLSPEIITLEISKEENEIKKLFYEAVNLNMSIYVYRTIWNGDEFYIKEDTQLEESLVANIMSGYSK